MGLMNIGDQAIANKGIEKRLDKILVELQAQGELMLEQTQLLREMREEMRK